MKKPIAVLIISIFAFIGIYAVWQFCKGDSGANPLNILGFLFLIGLYIVSLVAQTSLGDPIMDDYAFIDVKEEVQYPDDPVLGKKEIKRDDILHAKDLPTEEQFYNRNVGLKPQHDRVNHDMNTAHEPKKPL